MPLLGMCLVGAAWVPLLRPKCCCEKAHSLFGPSADWALWRWDSCLGSSPLGRVVPREALWKIPPKCQCQHLTASVQLPLRQPLSLRGLQTPVLHFLSQDPSFPSYLWKGTNIHWVRNFPFLVSFTITTACGWAPWCLQVAAVRFWRNLSFLICEHYVNILIY